MSLHQALLAARDPLATGYLRQSQERVEGCLDLSLGQVVLDPAVWRDFESKPNEGVLSYGNPRGDEDLITAFLQTHGGVQQSPLRQGADRHVLVTPGGKFALWTAFNLIVRPGSNLLLPSPGWAPYRIWASSLGGNISYYSPTDAGYADALALMRRGCVHTVVINSPNNPTGHALGQSDLDQFARDAASQGVSIIADEVYRTFGVAPTSLASMALQAETPIAIVDSVSKSLAAAGLRVGFLVSSERLIDDAIQFIALTLSGVSRSAQSVAATLLRRKPGLIETVRLSVSGRLNLLRGALSDHSVPVLSTGAIYAWLPPSPFVNGDGLTLPMGRVRGVAGEVFGAPGHLRICATSVLEAKLAARLGSVDE